MLQPCRIIGVILFVSGALSTSSFADVTLKIGDSAPSFSPGKFIQGEPVTQFEKGKIYVVEFWATWCPPCRESIPHLSQMQKANPNVTFIGCDVKEDEGTVKPFVTKMGDKMDYRVALDNMKIDGGANSVAFLDAAGQEEIPTAFVIDKDSKVAWIGHPMAMAPVLKQIVDGTFDLKKAAAIADSKARINALVNQKDVDGAIKLMKKIITDDPAQTGEIGGIEVLALINGKNDVVAAAKVADEIAPKVQEGSALSDMAWALVTADHTTPQTIATARKLAQLALEKEPDMPGYLDTLARVYAVQNDFKKAVEIETKALNKTTDDSEKADYTKALGAYKSGKIPSDN